MSDNPKGKDGLERLLARMKQEYKIWRSYVQLDTERWASKPWDMHAFTNIWVEGCREIRAAYFNGHLITWLIVTNLIALALLIWRW